jgi:hypothetical protein
LIAPPNSRFQVRIPCSQAEIAALLKDKHSQILPSVGCKKPAYSAVAAFMPGASPRFFDRQVQETKKSRIPPDQLSGHRIVRWRNVPKSGVGESMGQLVDLGASDYLLMAFEQRTPVTAESHAVAEQFLDSVVFDKR